MTVSSRRGFGKNQWYMFSKHKIFCNFFMENFKHVWKTCKNTSYSLLSINNDQLLAELMSSSKSQKCHLSSKYFSRKQRISKLPHFPKALGSHRLPGRAVREWLWDPGSLTWCPARVLSSQPLPQNSISLENKHYSGWRSGNPEFSSQLCHFSEP